MTLDNALAAFILDQRLKGNTDKTIAGYQGFLGQFITWLEHNGIKHVQDLTLSQVNAYQLHLDSRRCENKSCKLTKRTVRTYMRCIRIFLSFCYSENFIADPVHLKMKLPKAEKPVVEILTDEDVGKLLAVFGEDTISRRNKAIVCLMLDCGLRLSEVAGIRLPDINFDEGYIMVTGKGRKGRIVPIGKKVRQALEVYIRSRPDDSESFFLSVRKTPLSSNGIAQLMNRLKIQTGITRLHAHLLRHTYATNFLVHGLGDVYELSRLLGHGDIKITEGYLQLASYYTILQNRNRQTYLDMKEARKPT